MFGLRKKQMALPPPPAPMRVPVDRVMQLSQQGYSDPEIIRTLREEGFKPVEVDTALKQALKSSAFGPGGLRPRVDEELEEPGPVRSDLQLPELPWQQRPQPQRPAPASPEAPLPEDEGLPELPMRRPAPPPLGRPRMLPEDEELPELPTRRPAPPTAQRDRIAEVVEAALEEKWDAMQGELEALEHRIKALEDRAPGAQPAQDLHELEQKIDSSKQQSAELAAKMEAMERVVKDSLTPMMEAMRSLSDAIRELKQQRM